MRPNGAGEGGQVGDLPLGHGVAQTDSPERTTSTTHRYFREPPIFAGIPYVMHGSDFAGVLT